MSFGFEVDWDIEEEGNISESDDVTVKVTVTANALEAGWYAADAELIVHCEGLTILDSEETDITSDDLKLRIGLQNIAGDPELPEFSQDDYKQAAPDSTGLEPAVEKRYVLGDFEEEGKSVVVSFVLKTGSRLQNTPPALVGNYQIPCSVAFTAKEREPASHPGDPIEVASLSFMVHD